MAAKTCLIVDDSRVVRKVAGKILVDLGFTVSEAGDGKEALENCERGMPDVIMLDWNMPVMDGLQFIKALRTVPNGGVPIVIFCTTVNEMSRIKEAMVAGANEYIMKPFDAEIVKTKFEQVGLL